jgi:Beta-ketoacyl synthase, N-terminal domain/Starter unit:ACP transacylase in aflatoxin biosynthesis
MGSITISGPPSIRKRLYDESRVFQKAQRKDIPIRGPYHARHLYGLSDIDNILPDKLHGCQTVYPLISATGVLVPPGTATWDVLRQSVRDILMEPIQWAQAVETCVSEVKACHKHSCDILPMGPTALARSLASSLGNGRNLGVKVKDHQAFWDNDTQTANFNKKMAHSKIAIVGMAGRFPNAADHEEFWKLLENGLDVHREVIFAGLTVLKSNDFRSLKTASMLRLIQTQVVRGKIRVIRPTDVSSRIQGSLMPVSSTCRHAKLHKPILCSD